MLSVINSFYPLDVLFFEDFLVEITMRASLGRSCSFYQEQNAILFLSCWSEFGQMPQFQDREQNDSFTHSAIKNLDPKSAVFPLFFPLMV